MSLAPSPGRAHVPVPAAQASEGDWDWQRVVMVVGDTGTGKTCLCKWFRDGSFDAHTSSSVGIDYFTAVLPDHRLRLQLWDSAGKERFRDITTSNLPKCHAVIVVFDLSNAPSEPGGLHSVHGWLNDVRRSCKTPPLLAFAGTKADLVSDATRAAGVAEARSASLDAQATFFEVSAKAGTGIDSLVAHLVDAMATQHYRQLAQDVASGARSPPPSPKPSRSRRFFRLFRRNRTPEGVPGRLRTFRSHRTIEARLAVTSDELIVYTGTARVRRALLSSLLGLVRGSDDDLVLSVELPPEYEKGTLGPFLFRFASLAQCAKVLHQLLPAARVPLRREPLLSSRDGLLQTYEKACDRLGLPVGQRLGVRECVATGSFDARGALDDDVVQRDKLAIAQGYAYMRLQPLNRWTLMWCVVCQLPPASPSRARSWLRRAAAGSNSAAGGFRVWGLHAPRDVRALAVVSIPELPPGTVFQAARQPDWKRSPPWVIQLREVGSNARRGASVLRVATEADAAPWLTALNSKPRVPPPLPPRVALTHQQPSHQGDDGKATAGKAVTRQSIEEGFDSLSVSFVPNGSLHCQALSDGLMWNASITSLSLCRMQLGLEGLQVLAHALKSHPVLRHLELSGNCFGAACGRVLGELVAAGTTLETLAVATSSLGTGARALLNHVQACSSLTSLDLRGNDLHDMMLSGALGACLAANSTLRRLNLGFNYLTNDVCAGVAAGLGHNSTLEDLDLLNNAVDEDGDDTLRSAASPSLTSLHCVAGYPAFDDDASTGDSSGGEGDVGSGDGASVAPCAASDDEAVVADVEVLATAHDTAPLSPAAHAEPAGHQRTASGRRRSKRSSSRDLAAARTTRTYREFVAYVLATGEVTSEDRARLRRYQVWRGISDEQHEAVVGAEGWSMEAYEAGHLGTHHGASSRHLIPSRSRRKRASHSRRIQCPTACVAIPSTHGGADYAISPPARHSVGSPSLRGQSRLRLHLLCGLRCHEHGDKSPASVLWHLTDHAGYAMAHKTSAVVQAVLPAMAHTLRVLCSANGASSGMQQLLPDLKRVACDLGSSEPARGCGASLLQWLRSLGGAASDCSSQDGQPKETAPTSDPDHGGGGEGESATNSGGDDQLSDLELTTDDIERLQQLLIQLEAASTIQQAVGALQSVTVSRDGPAGAAGTAMWVCAQHAAQIRAWNAGHVDDSDFVAAALRVTRSAAARLTPDCDALPGVVVAGAGAGAGAGSAVSTSAGRRVSSSRGGTPASFAGSVLRLDFEP